MGRINNSYILMVVLLTTLGLAACKQNTSPTTLIAPIVVNDTVVPDDSINCAQDTLLPNGNSVLFVKLTSGKYAPLVFIQGVDTTLKLEYGCESINNLTVRYYSLKANSLYVALGVRQHFRELLVCHKKGKHIEAKRFECSLGVGAPDVFVYKDLEDHSHIYHIDRITGVTKKFALNEANSNKEIKTIRVSKTDMMLEFVDGSDVVVPY